MIIRRIYNKNMRKRSHLRKGVLVLAAVLIFTAAGSGLLLMEKTMPAYAAPASVEAASEPLASDEEGTGALEEGTDRKEETSGEEDASEGQAEEGESGPSEEKGGESSDEPESKEDPQTVDPDEDPSEDQGILVPFGNDAGAEPETGRIWFYNMAGGDRMNSEFILIQTGGYWGLIDSGNRYENTIIDSDGTSYKVPQSEALSDQRPGGNGRDAAEYLIGHLGVTHLDFILSTHAHSDHIGGVPEIAQLKYSDPEDPEKPYKYLIDENTLYLDKAYYHISDLNDDQGEAADGKSWHNQAFVYQAEEAVRQKGGTVLDISGGVRTSQQRQSPKALSELVTQLSGFSFLSDVQYEKGSLYNYFDDSLSFRFGNLSFSLYNLFSFSDALDENANSIVTVISDGSSEVFLGGDINADHRVEQQVAKAVAEDFGTIRFVKASHHGLDGSNTREVFDLFQPEMMLAASTYSDLSAPRKNGSYVSAISYAREKYGTRFYELGAADRFLVLEFGGKKGLELKQFNAEKGYFKADDCEYLFAPTDGFSPWYQEYLSAEDIDLYYFKDGKISVGWTTAGTKTYYFDENGIMKKGWLKPDQEHWYYLNADGEMQTGWTEVDGLTYYFAADGAMQKGWIREQGNWYYLEPTQGRRWTGWFYEGGSWYYMDPDSGAMSTGWTKAENEWYYMNTSGQLQTGWIRIGNSWFFFRPGGAMAEGWLYEGGNWYYMEPDSGIMRTGWVKEDETWYYLNTSGALQYGWLNSGGLWYYLGNGGAMTRGWLFSGGSWYYMDPEAGFMHTGWAKDKETWYYLDLSGVLKTGTQTIDGIVYELDPATGAWKE